MKSRDSSEGERRLEEYQRQTWFGAKAVLKGVLSLRPFNACARALIRLCRLGRRCSEFPVNLPEIAGEVEGGSFVMLDPLRCSIARELYWGGGRRLLACERYALELFCRLAKDRDVILDIGANTGLFSLAAAAASPRAEVHAFEIVPEVFALLRRNCARNGLHDRVSCHDFGLGSENRVIRLPEAPAGGSLPLSYSSDWDGALGREVRFRSLDGLLPMFPDRSRKVLAKIDVEGTEDEVFRYGHEFLRAFRPELLCELLPGAAKVEFLEPLLLDLGYSFFKIGPDSLIKSPHLAPDPEFHDWLFTASPLPGEAA